MEQQKYDQTEANKGIFMESPFREIGGEGGFAGAGNAKIDVEDMGMLWAEEREQEEREIN